MRPFKTCVRCTHVAIEVSSYEELLTNRYTPNHVFQAFPELPLGVLIVAYLRGIRADNIENQVLNYQLDQDNPVPTSLDVYHPILEALVDQDAYAISVCSRPRVPQLEAGILHLLRLLSSPFGFLDAKDINTSPHRCIN
ncbi:hypothetical protein ACQJBY_007754 [Aegilops geniculata]